MVRYDGAEQPHIEMAAVICNITTDGEVQVCAFDPVFGPRNHMTMGQGTGPGEWSWPPRD